MEQKIAELVARERGPDKFPEVRARRLAAAESVAFGNPLPAPEGSGTRGPMRQQANQRSRGRGPLQVAILAYLEQHPAGGTISAIQSALGRQGETQVRKALAGFVREGVVAHQQPPRVIRTDRNGRGRAAPTPGLYTLVKPSA